MNEPPKGKLGRREFLGAAAAASFMILKPQQVRGTEANSQLRFGILGCGGRATAEATSFVENAGTRVTASPIFLPINWRKAAGTSILCSRQKATLRSTRDNSIKVQTLIRKSPIPRKWTLF